MPTSKVDQPQRQVCGCIVCMEVERVLVVVEMLRRWTKMCLQVAALP